MTIAADHGLRRRLRHAVLERLAALTRHPVVSVLVGIGLLLSGFAELLAESFEEFETSLRTYHGFILLGLVTALRGFAEFIEGIVWLSRDAEAAEERETAPERHR
jgi:hypothetical protein